MLSAKAGSEQAPQSCNNNNKKRSTQPSKRDRAKLPRDEDYGLDSNILALFSDLKQCQQRVHDLMSPPSVEAVFASGIERVEKYLGQLLLVEIFYQQQKDTMSSILPYLATTNLGRLPVRIALVATNRSNELAAVSATQDTGLDRTLFTFCSSVRENQQQVLDLLSPSFLDGLKEAIFACRFGHLGFGRPVSQYAGGPDMEGIKKFIEPLLQAEKLYQQDEAMISSLFQVPPIAAALAKKRRDEVAPAPAAQDNGLDGDLLALFSNLKHCQQQVHSLMFSSLNSLAPAIAAADIKFIEKYLGKLLLAQTHHEHGKDLMTSLLKQVEDTKVAPQVQEFQHQLQSLISQSVSGLTNFISQDDFESIQDVPGLLSQAEKFHQQELALMPSLLQQLENTNFGQAQRN